MWWTTGWLACAPGAPDPPAGPARPAAEMAPLPATARRDTWEEMTRDAAAPRHPGDGGGRLVELAPPTPGPAGSPVALQATLEVGPEGIAVGGAVQVIVSPFWGWSPPQASSSAADGFTVLEGPEGVWFEPRAGGGMLQGTVRGRALQAGERVRISWAGRSDRFAETAPALWVGVDADGDGVRALVPGELAATTEPGPPFGLVLTVPSAVAPGARPTLRIAVVDALGNAFLPLRGEVALSAGPGLAVPERVTLGPGGVAAVPLRAERPGLYRVVAVGPGGLSGTSNPLVVREGAEPILWADLHVHTALSDGTGTPEAVLRYAREVAGLDVVALTDHDHWGMRFLDRHAALREGLQRAVDAADEPGAFVAVHGFEWTSWTHGHRTVLDFDGPGPWWSSLDPETATPAGLWAALGDRRVLTVPHHPAGGPIAIDWSVASDPDHEPVVELVSVHGQSADPALPGAIYDPVPGAFVEDRLLEGRRFGLIGASDAHDGHPGLAGLVAGMGGLAALPGAEPTRDGVYAALRARRTYATSGPRIVLRFEVDGAPMGSVVPAAGPVEAEVRVIGTAPIARVELRGREGLLGSRTGGGGALHATWTLSPRPGDAVWVRVLQEDGGLAWSSPVFFD